jgi:hypothetical protein
LCLQVNKAVVAVLSAFHSSAELVDQLKKKLSRQSSLDKKGAQHDSEQKQLQVSLETGEKLLSQQFASDVRELGDIMDVGDGPFPQHLSEVRKLNPNLTDDAAIARDRLLHVSVVIRAEIIKSLELAVKFENAVLNLKILYEASITHRTDSMIALDELKQRILLTRIIPRILPGTPKGQRTSLERVPTFHPKYSASAAEKFDPSAENIPASGNSKQYEGGLVSYLYMRHSESLTSTSDEQRSRSSSESTTFSPALDHLLQGSDNRAAIMKDIDEIIISYQGLQTGGSKRDTWAILTGGDVSKRDTVALNREAMEMLQLQNLPPTPEEANDVNDIHTQIRASFCASKPIKAAPSTTRAARATMVCE